MSTKTLVDPMRRLGELARSGLESEDQREEFVRLLEEGGWLKILGAEVVLTPEGHELLNFLRSKQGDAEPPLLAHPLDPRTGSH